MTFALTPTQLLAGLGVLFVLVMIWRGAFAGRDRLPMPLDPVLGCCRSPDASCSWPA